MLVTFKWGDNKVIGGDCLIEKELKALINDTTYREIFNHFEWDEQISQVNYYYCDKDEVIIKEGIGVRVRSINDGYFIQIKRPVLMEGALSIKDEYEEQIYTIPHYISSVELRNWTGFEIGDAHLIGDLKRKDVVSN